MTFSAARIEFGINHRTISPIIPLGLGKAMLAKSFTLVFPRKCVERFMGFLWTGLDESADRERKHVFVVAGYLARQREWTEIERQWMLRLERENNPQPMKYFKSSECQRLTGEFARFRDKHKYPPPQGRIAANNVRDDLLGIMKSSRAVGFSVGVLLKDYRSIRRNARAKKVLPADPYLETYFQSMIQIAGDLIDEMPKTETVAFLCDSHNLAAKLLTHYPDLKKYNPLCAEWMGTLTPMDDKDSPALQAGDLLAAKCKDVLAELVKTPNKRTLRDTFKARVGSEVAVRYMNKKFLQLLVDANLLRNGKPSLGSTQQYQLFKDIWAKGDA